MKGIKSHNLQLWTFHIYLVRSLKINQFSSILKYHKDFSFSFLLHNWIFSLFFPKNKKFRGCEYIIFYYFDFTHSQNRQKDTLWVWINIFSVMVPPRYPLNQLFRWRTAPTIFLLSLLQSISFFSRFSYFGKKKQHANLSQINFPNDLIFARATRFLFSCASSNAMSSVQKNIKENHRKTLDKYSLLVLSMFLREFDKRRLLSSLSFNVFLMLFIFLSPYQKKLRITKCFVFECFITCALSL